MAKSLETLAQEIVAERETLAAMIEVGMWGGMRSRQERRVNEAVQRYNMAAVL